MISNDDVFDALADVQRRRILVQLLYSESEAVPHPSSASREMLQAHEEVLQEYLTGPEEVANADKAVVRTYHVHLPKLVESLYVEWDRGNHHVTKGAKYDEVRPVLELVDERRGEGQRNEAIPRPAGDDHGE